jgi:hypothetical protein
VDRYAMYEAIRDQGIAARLQGMFSLGDALLEFARLVLAEREKEAADALRRLPLKG